MLLSIHSNISRQGSWAFLECRPCVKEERMFHLCLISLLHFSVAEHPWGNLRYFLWGNNLSKKIFYVCAVCVKGKGRVHCSIPKFFYVFSSNFPTHKYDLSSASWKTETQSIRWTTDHKGGSERSNSDNKGICILTVINGSWKLDGVPEKSVYMDRCLNKGHALINSERRHVKSYSHPACPSSSCDVSGLRGERKCEPSCGFYT